MKNMKNKIIKLLAWICMGLSLFMIAGCDNTRGAEPMLKITTSTGNMIFPATKTNYYIVYENGAVKKTSEFVPSDVINYYFSNNDYGAVAKDLYDLNINTPQGEELKKIANNILLLMDDTKLKIISVNELFILGDRYFFDVLSSSGKKEKISSKLFEYNNANNSIKEIASVSTGSINHVELYESQ